MFPKFVSRFESSSHCPFILDSLVTHWPQPPEGGIQFNPSTHTTSTVERLKSATIFLPSTQPKSKEPPLGITAPVKLRAARPEFAGGLGGVGQPLTWVMFIRVNEVNKGSRALMNTSQVGQLEKSAGSKELLGPQITSNLPAAWNSLWIFKSSLAKFHMHGQANYHDLVSRWSGS